MKEKSKPRKVTVRLLEESRGGPIVADTTRCRAAAETFIETAAGDASTPAQRYRNVAHAYGIVRYLMSTERQKARDARIAETKAFQAKMDEDRKASAEGGKA